MLNPEKLQNGEEQYEEYTDRVLKKQRVQYDYRREDGTLFSCVGPTLSECRKKRDVWLMQN